MPNIKSAKKRVKVIETKTLENNMKKSALKTAVKKAKAAMEAGTADAAKDSFKSAVKLIDKAAADNIMHKNTAARKKSQLQKQLNSMNA